MQHLKPSIDIKMYELMKLKQFLVLEKKSCLVLEITYGVHFVYNNFEIHWALGEFNAEILKTLLFILPTKILNRLRLIRFGLMIFCNFKLIYSFIHLESNIILRFRFNLFSSTTLILNFPETGIRKNGNLL